MKQKFSLTAFLGDWALLFCGALGAPLCIFTAYNVPFSRGEGILLAALLTGFLTLMFGLPRYGPWCIVPFGIGVILYSLFCWENIYSGALLAVSTVQDVLSGTIPFVPAPPADALLAEGISTTPFLGALVLALGLFMAWGLCAGESVWLSLSLPLPFLALSIIYFDLPPSRTAVALLMVYFGGVLITGGLRRHAPGARGAVSLGAIGALCLLCLILHAALPEEAYVPRDTESMGSRWQEKLETWYEQAKRLFDDGVKSTENLQTQGERLPEGIPALEVKSSRTGTLYLRGYSLGVYKSSRWEAGSEYAGDTEGLTLLGSHCTPADTVEIRSQGQGLLYTPYGFAYDGQGALTEQYLRAGGLDSYTLSYCAEWPRALDTPAQTAAEKAYGDWVQENYTRLDPQIKERLRTLASQEGIYPGNSPYATALKVASYVRTLGEYTLTPGKVPSDQDFVLYFLEQSQRGYCVHFASAAAAMLQALDIPARYVTGYALQVQADAWTEVTDQNAHAWVEVYCQGVGWVMVEATAVLENSSGQGPESTPPPAPTATPAPTEVPEPASSETPTDVPATLMPAQAPSEEEKQTPVPLIGADQTDTPAQEGGENGGEDAEAEGKTPVNLSFLWWLLIPLLLFGLWYLYRRESRRRFAQGIRQENGNKAVLYIYGRLRRLEKLGAAMPKEGERLAEKAFFSQHALTRVERKQMETLLYQCTDKLEAALPGWKILLLRDILCLWQ